MKRSILSDYEAKYGTGTTFQQQGERSNFNRCLPTVSQAILSSTMRPSINIAYGVEDLHFPDMLFTVLREHGCSLSPNDWLNLSLIRKEYKVYVPGILRLLAVDFFSCCNQGLVMRPRKLWISTELIWLEL